MKKVICIVGATGSGKTKIANLLAQTFDLDLINFDIYQMYKYFSIGTGKEINPHLRNHFFDFLEPSSKYSIYHYQKSARELIDNLSRPPILVGGSFLYLASVIKSYKFSPIEIQDRDYDLTNQQLYDRLLALDPDSASTIHINNRKRLIHALNLAEQGIKKENSSRLEAPFYQSLIIMLDLDRKLLRDKAGERLDKMIENGLVDEVKHLKISYSDSQCFQAIGYQEISDYLDGKITLDEAISNAKRRTNRYIKRQQTFLEHQFSVIKVNPENLDEILSLVKEYISGNN